MAIKQMTRLFCTALICVAAWSGPAAADTFRIVGFGDSLMAGYNLGPAEGFPQKLEAALKGLGHDVTVVNAGVSGDTTAGGLSRLDWSVPDGTDLVILQLGANDMLRGLSPQNAEANLDRMMASLKERGIGIVLAGMLAAPNLGPDYGNAFNGMFPKLARKYDAPLIPFFLEGVTGNRSLLLDDGLHPNAEGVDRMVEVALPLIEPLVR